MEVEDDIQFLPFLDFMGRPQLLSEPLEIGGKIKASCRNFGEEKKIICDLEEYRKRLMLIRIYSGPRVSGSGLW